jgi:hypothetical protein
MNCSDVIARLPDLLDPEVPPAEKAPLEAHIRTCPTCAQEWARQEKAGHLLRKSLQDFDPWPERSFSFRFPEPTTLPWWKRAFHLLQNIRSQALIPTAVVAALLIAILGHHVLSTSPHPSSEFEMATGSIRHLASGFLLSSAANLESGSYETIAEARIRIGPADISPEKPGIHVQIAAGSRFSLAVRSFKLLHGGIQVTHEKIPVSIHLPVGEIQMIGTQFVVVANARNAFISVAQGRVEIFSQEGSLPLSANDACLVSQGAFPVSLNAQTADEAWKSFHQSGGNPDAFFAALPRPTSPASSTLSPVIPEPFTANPSPGIVASTTLVAPSDFPSNPAMTTTGATAAAPDVGPGEKGEQTPDTPAGLNPLEQLGQ